MVQVCGFVPWAWMCILACLPAPASQKFNRPRHGVRLVDRMQLRDHLQFDDQRVFDDKVESITAIQ